MVSELIMSEMIEVILESGNQKKLELGQRFSLHLGLEPGETGPDEGIDGYRFIPGLPRIHFQSKLKSSSLGRDDARLYYSDLDYHRIDISIYLAGRGYKETFAKRLYGHQKKYKCHLLCLYDLLAQTSAFHEATMDLPPLRTASEIAYAFYKQL